MGIDVNRLAPWAQAQIARKLAAQARDKAEKQAAAQEEKKNKYRNTPTDRQGAEGKKIRFDSKREAARYDELMLMLKAGKIRDLKLQPQFTLQEAYTTPEGNRLRAIIYKADFSYEEQITTHFVESRTDYHYDDTSWQFVVEDVKSKATKTRVYAMKKKLLREKFGIDIVEVE
jgi:hypothetical protein